MNGISHSMVHQELGNLNSRLTSSGRVKSIRRLGQGLAFVDLAQTGYLAQGICSQGRIVGSGTSIDQFQDLFRKMQRGDIFSRVLYTRSRPLADC